MLPLAGWGENPIAAFTTTIHSRTYRRAATTSSSRHEIIQPDLHLEREIEANEVRMKSYIFRVAIEPDKFEDGRDAWHAFCPALKGCHTWGHTHDEALANLREAIDLYVQDLIEAGEEIPVNQGTIELPEPAVVVNV